MTSLNRTVTVADVDELVEAAKRGVIISDIPVSQRVLDALTEVVFAAHPNQALIDNVYKAFEDGSADVDGVLFKEFDEDKHPRDKEGKFTSGGAESGSAESGGRVDRNNVMSKLWRPALTRLDELNAKYGSSSNYGFLADHTNGEAGQEMKALVAEDIAGRMSDLSPMAVMEAGGMDTSYVPVALEDPENFLAPGDGGQDYQIVSLDSRGTLVVEDARSLLNDYLSEDGWEKQDVIDALEGINTQPVGEPPNYAIQGSYEAEEMVRQAGVAGLVSEWAQTSNDSSPISLAMQNVAEREFGIQGAAPWDTFAKIQEQTADYQEKYGDVYSAFLRAQYDNTQEFLKSQGVTELEVYRGINNLEDSEMAQVNSAREQDMQFRPLTSWTVDEAVAFKFAGGDYHEEVSESAAMVHATIPASQVFSIPATGVGCLHEAEVVALGGTMPVEVVNAEKYYYGGFAEKGWPAK